MTAAPVVELRSFGWRHPRRRSWALADLDLVVRSGERVLVCGASGSGKSTLLAAVAGLLDHDSGGEARGRILLNGADAGRGSAAVGYVGQDPDSQVVMERAGDEVALALENRAVPGTEIWSRVDATLADVSWPYDRARPTGALSGGERQRLVLAAALVANPSVLLLDEPTSNLDPDGAAAFREAVRARLADPGVTMVLVDHRVTDWLPLIDRVLVLDEGTLVADGAPSDVFVQTARLERLGVWTPAAEVGEPAARTNPVGAPLLEAIDAGYTYRTAGMGPSRAGLTRLSVTLSAASVVALHGPNGSGKSTALRLLGGLLRPSRGTVEARPALGRPHGRPEPVRWSAAALAARIGSVFQNPEHMFLAATVRDELALARRMSGPGEPGERIDQLVEVLGLGGLASAHPFTLSGGEQRRLSVAVSLAAEPRVLLLDEPTYGQDRRTWQTLLDLVRGARDAGAAVALASHDPAFVAALGARPVPMPL